jgi:hypothetical protein
MAEESNGGRTRTRTWDPLIKSQLLYQLSYAPEPGTDVLAGKGPEGRGYRALACPAQAPLIASQTWGFGLWISLIQPEAAARNRSRRAC